ncbi:MAG TPA: DUF2490 domain-containing protein, partial [Cyclobacteriaceae bacterium]|nr:DUF2490 domain-containing protein [Cyclobacteriaceae bacterium]
MPSLAQVNEESNTLVWIDAYLVHNFTERVKVNPGLGYRRNINNESWKQIFFNPVVTYQLNNTLQAQGSLVLAYTDEMDNTIFEIRPWQGILVSYPR